MNPSHRTGWAVALVLCSLTLAALACAANAKNMTVLGTPMYICPSSTPKPTDILPPPDPPTYPASFQANLNYYFVDPSRDVVFVQYLAQSVGWLSISYTGTYASGMGWPGSNGSLYVAYAGYNQPGFGGSYAIAVPADVNQVQISLSSSSGGTYPLSVIRYASVVSSLPVNLPCCLPAPIYPTPRPTYTPYPTPTLYSIPPYHDGVYFLDDPVYNYLGDIRLRLRMKSPIYENEFAPLPIFRAAAWTLEITNVGSVEFDFLGGLQTYVSEINQDGTLKPVVLSPSHWAAIFLGVVEQAYYPRAILPGETVTVRVAAWIPAHSHVSRVSLVLDLPSSGDPGYATFVPGSGKGHVATWVNQVNTICKGEIAYP